MIYVSMIEIIPKAQEALESSYGARTGYWLTTAAFFAGILCIAIIDKLIPEADNPHEIRSYNQKQGKDQVYSSLHRTGIFVALAIAIHNFPEGLATFMSALRDPMLGVSIAVAIALHNIPEGISVSVPIYNATGSKKKAFVYSFLSGLAEPVGALLGFTLLSAFMSNLAFGSTFAGVAGIMVYISVDELLPTAEKYGRHHLCITGFIAGMALMALSLMMFK
jgi:ZIP family zinc transporter